MPRFNVYGIWSASKFLGEFEADTAEAAEEMAAESEANHASLCHQCAGVLNLSDYSASEFEVEPLD